MGVIACFSTAASGFCFLDCYIAIAKRVGLRGHASSLVISVYRIYIRSYLVVGLLLPSRKSRDATLVAVESGRESKGFPS